ncbi:LytR/AlgR family response regulator transcription factor [Paenibacillus hemerocallicola]|nr:LytTR family DNA-binding domain-containing protein [Paenibacillus hemerocallicola]
MGGKMKTRIVLADDNEDELNILRHYIGQLPDFHIVDTCRNGEELIDSVMKSRPDAILLDIRMPKLNGLEAIRACLKIISDLLFIFVTSDEEYAVQAFELCAVDYVMKPVEKGRLYSALEKINKIRRRTEPGQALPGTVEFEKRLIIREGNDYYFIPVKDILFIEKIGKKCHIYTAANEYVTNDNIGEMLQQLPDHLFFLSHRSYIVNITKIYCVLARNQTYLAYFPNTSKYAHVSKLKIEELQNKLK